MAQYQDLVTLAEALHMRPDWHEPDEQGVSAKVVGKSLDNAFGDSRLHAIDGLTAAQTQARYGELLVIVRYPDGELTINLASLLADYCRLARQESLQPV